MSPIDSISPRISKQTNNLLSKNNKILKLPKDAQKYIFEVVSTVSHYLGKDSIKSIVLFGSLSYGTITNNSDVDLLLVVSNKVSFRKIRKIHHILQTIEIKHNYLSYPKNLIERILRVVERKTGMFCSHFICREDDWQNDKFARILSVNRTISRFLAPDKIVLDSLKKGATVLYGQLDLSMDETPYSYLQILKSLLMTLFLAYGAILIIPFDRKFNKYILEAYKWALRASFFYLFQKTAKLTEICNYFTSHGFSKHYMSLFNFYRRQTYSGFHVRFCLRVPFEIMKLHTMALKLQKRQEKKNDSTTK
ncbi:MAG: nucleotidyltransferase domain-containing protein [Candidatus Lokiarchaeota archaeon]|nr:nucleotidyltransferase domain-containing protein [Candidatus Harpocratesius repetitus]